MRSHLSTALCNAVYMISWALHNSEKSTELVMDKMTENYKVFSNENKALNL